MALRSWRRARARVEAGLPKAKVRRQATTMGTARAPAPHQYSARPNVGPPALETRDDGNQEGHDLVPAPQ
jgi:hypothetical protein